MKFYSIGRVAVSIAAISRLVAGTSVINATTTDVAEDVADSERLITNSFQQDAIVSFGGYQYVSTYTTSEYGGIINHVTIGRRTISPTSDWEFLTLTDYNQTTDDGHNVVSMGISTGDGRIHLSFDHHVCILYFQKRVPRDSNGYLLIFGYRAYQLCSLYMLRMTTCIIEFLRLESQPIRLASGTKRCLDRFTSGACQAFPTPFKA
jgi:hypothetical protein